MTTQRAEPNVMQVIAPAPFGGAESVARALARAYPGPSTLAVLLQDGEPHPFATQLREDGAEMAVIVGGRRRYDREVDGLVDLIRDRRPDVLHTHIYHADFVGYFAARRCGIPIVAHVHGITGGDLKDRTYQWFDLRLLRRFDALICVSDSVRQRVVASGCDVERTALVTNPYAPCTSLSVADARKALGLPDDRPVLGWIGRVSIEKGADLLMQAIAKLPTPRPRVAVIGDGPELANTRELADRLGVSSDVRFAGNIPNAASLLRAFDALVLSSRTEGLPMTLLEAMGAGIPVVAFAVGGIPDAVGVESAWLAPPTDVNALAAAMTSALTNTAEAHRRAARAAEIVERRFGIGPWVEALVGTYRTAMQRFRASAPYATVQKFS